MMIAATRVFSVIILIGFSSEGPQEGLRMVCTTIFLNPYGCEGRKVLLSQRELIRRGNKVWWSDSNRRTQICILFFQVEHQNSSPRILRFPLRRRLRLMAYGPWLHRRVVYIYRSKSSQEGYQDPSKGSLEMKLSMYWTSSFCKVGR